MTYGYRCSVCKWEFDTDERKDELEWPHMTYDSSTFCGGRLRRVWPVGLLRENLKAEH